MKQCKCLWLGVGLCIGFAAGMLLAPESGNKTREFLGEIIDEYAKMFRGIITERELPAEE
ncbi:MAG: YtxH domain-containing protein [Vulcanimicrobiota bacterium]